MKIQIKFTNFYKLWKYMFKIFKIIFIEFKNILKSNFNFKFF